ncbi:MAG: hypothetical protein Q9219_003888 [cf. Caloplaca sp. 3 TL-2023]
MDQLPLRPAESLPPFGMQTTTRNTKFDRPSAFSFSQTIRDQPDGGLVPGYTALRTEGQIHIKVSNRPASEQSIWVENEIQSHDPSLVDVAFNENGITITTPSFFQPTQSTNNPAVFIRSTVHVSRNLHLSRFYLETTSFPINISQGIPFHPHTQLHISAPSSALYYSGPTPSQGIIIDARSTSMNSTSGSINGDFCLRDSLAIHTVSGSIDITLSLLPSKSNSTTTTPATLDLKSASGSIAVRTTALHTPQQIPDRDYRSTIRSNSGSLMASLVHGSSTELKSDNGRIQASLYPHGNASLRSDLSTRSISGGQDVTVHASLTDASAPLRNFYAQHHGVSGSIRLEYPAQWEGVVQGETVSGGVAVMWPGLKVVEDGKGWGRKRFKGVKGSGGGGVVGFKDVSGSVDVRGREEVVVAVVEEEEEKGIGNRAARDEEAETETETEVGKDVVLTPQSEAGDEWMWVQ